MKMVPSKPPPRSNVNQILQLLRTQRKTEPSAGHQSSGAASRAWQTAPAKPALLTANQRYGQAVPTALTNRKADLKHTAQ